MSSYVVHRFTARISATSLFHIVFRHLPASKKQDFKNSYIKLCTDDTPMVRRMAAENFQKLASQLSIQEIQEEFLLPFNKLAADDQDSVRIQAINICTGFAQTLPEEFKVCTAMFEVTI